jgi:hypothetical protein
MINQDVPDPVEVSAEGFRIIELLSEFLVRIPVIKGFKDDDYKDEIL